MQKIVSDTSVIINGQLITQIESGLIRNSEIIIPQAVFDELQSQASENKKQGLLKSLKVRVKKRRHAIRSLTSCPSLIQIQTILVHNGKILILRWGQPTTSNPFRITHPQPRRIYLELYYWPR